MTKEEFFLECCSKNIAAYISRNGFSGSTYRRRCVEEALRATEALFDENGNLKSTDDIKSYFHF
ncbi:MAG: hypothetical protein HUK03_05805 [Bacteroidaceae bacterium]|nr:hypothetical protein [Bacteroidaceae bacterium]